MDNTEKSKVIGERLEIIKPCKCKNWDYYPFEGKYKCRSCCTEWNKYPDFFTPDGQVVLLDSLYKRENMEILSGFLIFLGYKKFKPDNFIIHIGHMLLVIKETKLAELFYEFIESEKDND